jgi:hypothetical protein
LEFGPNRFIIIYVSIINKEDLKKLDTYHILILIMLFSVVIGVHGLLHLGIEFVYKWNPLEPSESKQK